MKGIIPILSGIAILLLLHLSSCKDYFEDGFEITLPPESQINVPFPGLVNFEIISTVVPSVSNGNDSISNVVRITNLTDQPIERLNFGIHISKSDTFRESDLAVVYLDSLKETLAPRASTREDLVFDRTYRGPIEEKSIQVFIINQDVFENHPFRGVFSGEAFHYTKNDTIPSQIPIINGRIDYRGDLVFQASGREVEEYVLSGRLSRNGLFNGTTAGNDNRQNSSLRGRTLTGNISPDGQLELRLAPLSPENTELDSITLKLNRY